MLKRKNILLINILISFSVSIFAQEILLDENFDDWNQVDLFVEEFDENLILDIQRVFITNDDENIYFRIDLNDEVQFQESSELILFLDADNNAQTGEQFEDIGSELVFNFSQRRGRLNQSFSRDIFHNDIGLISSPTVSSNIFEFKIHRNLPQYNFETGDTIRFYIKGGDFLGDVIPNREESNIYILKDNITPFVQELNVSKINPSDLRICSYNVLRDNIFETFLSSSYENILNLINADIMCFQEIYNNSPSQLLRRLEDINVLNLEDEQWYSEQNGSDLITLSKYPIVYNQEVAGNSFIVIDKDGTDIVILNCHLPCCDNNNGRQREIDEILSFIRDSREGLTDYTIDPMTPIVILGDMNFVGFSSQVKSLMTGDISDNNRYGEDFNLDWDESELGDVKARNIGTNHLSTWYNPNGSFSAGRLDYILYTDAVMDLENSFVLSSFNLSNDDLVTTNLRSTDSSRASDHSPVVADFSFPLSSNVEVATIEDVNIYPNPSHGFININSPYEIREIDLLSIEGKLIGNYKTDHNHFKLPVHKIGEGTYILRIKKQTGEIISKLIEVVK